MSEASKDESTIEALDRKLAQIEHQIRDLRSMLASTSGLDESQDNDRPFTPETLATHWGCSGRHVRNLLERGELRFFRLGAKLIRIPAEAVREYECQQSRSHTQSAAIVADSRLSGMKETASGIGTRLEPMTRAKLSGRLRRSTQN